VLGVVVVGWRRGRMHGSDCVGQGKRGLVELTKEVG
jgi:hypothetical protein